MHVVSACRQGREFTIPSFSQQEPPRSRWPPHRRQYQACPAVPCVLLRCLSSLLTVFIECRRSLSATANCSPDRSKFSFLHFKHPPLGQEINPVSWRLACYTM